MRFQGDNWQARTKRAGKELSLGLYNTAEEAGMAYDLDRLQQQGGKAQRLNFPLLRQHYKQILADLTDLYTPDGLLDFLAVAVQAAVKSARNVPGATAPENTGPAAASMLNPRRAIAPAVHAATHAAVLARQAVVQARPEAAAAVAAVAAAADVDSEAEDPPADEPELAMPPTQQQMAAHQQAEQLAAACPLSIGMADGVAHVRLEAGSGLAWRMTYLACPVGATMGQVAEVRSRALIDRWLCCSVSCCLFGSGRRATCPVDPSFPTTTLCGWCPAMLTRPAMLWPRAGSGAWALAAAWL